MYLEEEKEKKKTTERMFITKKIGLYLYEWIKTYDVLNFNKQTRNNTLGHVRL